MEWGKTCFTVNVNKVGVEGEGKRRRSKGKRGDAGAEECRVEMEEISGKK